MKELLTAIEYNLGMLALRIRKVREGWDGINAQAKAQAEGKLKKINELLYEVSDLIEEVETEGELYMFPPKNLMIEIPQSMTSLE